MGKFEIGICGSELESCILALAVLQQKPRLSVALWPHNASRSAFEFLMPSRTSKYGAEIFYSSVVMQWDAFYIQRRDRLTKVSREICLLDSTQARLEVAGRIGFEAVFDLPVGLRFPDGGEGWMHGETEAKCTFKFPSASFEATPWTILEADFLDQLVFPVLADFDVTAETNRFMQYVPLTHGRLMSREVRYENLPDDMSSSEIADQISGNYPWHSTKKADHSPIMQLADKIIRGIQ